MSYINQNNFSENIDENEILPIKGYAVDSKKVDASELFLGDLNIGENISNHIKEINEKLISNNKTQLKEFSDTAFTDDQKSKEEEYKVEEIICKVLDLKNELDLKLFNTILNKNYSQKGNVRIKMMEKQFSEKDGTFLVFLIYETLKFRNPLGKGEIKNQ